MNLLLLIVGICGLLFYSGGAELPVGDFRDAAAVDFAVATMTDSDGPAPNPPTPFDCPRCQDTGWITHGDGHRTPCPDCRDGNDGPYGGPIDMYRDAKELIRKGNELADRGKAILDEAERDGKITVDIQLPKPSVTAASSNPSCPTGGCPLPTSLPATSLPATSPPTETERKTPIVSTPQSCTTGTCRPRIFRRRRR